MDEPISQLSESLRLRLDDKRTLVALGVALFGLGIVLGFRLAGGQRIDLEDCGCDETSISDVAAASAVMVDDGEPFLASDVQPTPLPAVEEYPTDGLE